MHRAAVCLISLALTASTSHVFAFELQQAEARFADDQYQFEMTATLDVSIEYVERVLRDYESYPTLDGRILDARVIERPEEHVALLATTVRACIGPVCRNVKRVERVEEAARSLIATTDVSRSDMKFGETRMQLEPTDTGGTLVTYRTRMTPAFWVPALVARRMMLRTLEDATIELFTNVERRALEYSAHE